MMPTPSTSGAAPDLHQILAEGLDVMNHSAWADACATDIPD